MMTCELSVRSVRENICRGFRADQATRGPGLCESNQRQTLFSTKQTNEVYKGFIIWNLAPSITINVEV